MKITTLRTILLFIALFLMLGIFFSNLFAYNNIALIILSSCTLFCLMVIILLNLLLNDIKGTLTFSFCLLLWVINTIITLIDKGLNI